LAGAKDFPTGLGHQGPQEHLPGGYPNEPPGKVRNSSTPIAHTSVPNRPPCEGSADGKHLPSDSSPAQETRAASVRMLLPGWVGAFSWAVPCSVEGGFLDADPAPSIGEIDQSCPFG